MTDRVETRSVFLAAEGWTTSEGTLNEKLKANPVLLGHRHVSGVESARANTNSAAIQAIADVLWTYAQKLNLRLYGESGNPKLLLKAFRDVNDEILATPGELEGAVGSALGPEAASVATACNKLFVRLEEAKRSFDNQQFADNRESVSALLALSNDVTRFLEASATLSQTNAAAISSAVSPKRIAVNRALKMMLNFHRELNKTIKSPFNLIPKNLDRTGLKKVLENLQTAVETAFAPSTNGRSTVTGCLLGELGECTKLFNILNPVCTGVDNALKLMGSVKKATSSLRSAKDLLVKSLSALRGLDAPIPLASKTNPLDVGAAAQATGQSINCFKVARGMLLLENARVGRSQPVQERERARKTPPVGALSPLAGIQRPGSTGQSAPAAPSAPSAPSAPAPLGLLADTRASANRVSGPASGLALEPLGAAASAPAGLPAPMVPTTAPVGLAPRAASAAAPSTAAVSAAADSIADRLANRVSSGISAMADALGLDAAPVQVAQRDSRADKSDRGDRSERHRSRDRPERPDKLDRADKHRSRERASSKHRSSGSSSGEAIGVAPSGASTPSSGPSSGLSSVANSDSGSRSPPKDVPPRSARSPMHAEDFSDFMGPPPGPPGAPARRPTSRDPRK
jgi:hypothetical protein